MAVVDVNPAARPGHLVEAHSTFQPRIFFFYFVLSAMLLVLAADLAYQQLFRTDAYKEVERMQNERRILLPGPRGEIVDREGRALVLNRPRWAVMLYLGELRQEFLRERIQIRKNYREAGDKDMPTRTQMERIARATVVQRYLDQVNAALGSKVRVDGAHLQLGFQQERLLPYTLVDDLSPEECARLTERLPVRSPLKVYASSTRYYPYDSAAAHTLGYVSINPDIDAQDFPGEDLHTFRMKGSIGRDGLEKQFDAQLQGKAGGAIFRVDPDGYSIDKPIDRLAPVEGGKVVTSLDLDLQLAAEEALGDQTGAVVTLDVNTGEVLVLASKPDYNLNDFTPRLNQATVDDIETRKAWVNLAVNGFYPPGSTFKILTTIAALRSGAITPDRVIVDCEGTTRIGNRTFFCNNGNGQHGEVLLAEAIAQSCDIYFYAAGALTTPQVLAAEARRFHLDRRTGIELPGEAGRMLIPDPAWKQRERGVNWYPGDTANMAIGQGDVLVSPLQMACFVASVARGEVFTQPTLLHHDHAAPQKTEPIGLTLEQRTALLDGMEGSTTRGSAKVLSLPELKIPGLRIAGKTGTAQVPGRKNVAWFICFAPIEQPEIAIAVAVEGDIPGENFGGGRYAAPIANSVLKKWWEKKQRGGALVAPKILPHP